MTTIRTSGGAGTNGIATNKIVEFLSKDNWLPHRTTSLVRRPEYEGIGSFLLEGRPSRQRGNLWEALGEIGGEKATAILVEHLTDEYWDVRYECARVLKTIRLIPDFPYKSSASNADLIVYSLLMQFKIVFEFLSEEPNG